jgi:hypothetical protein
MEIRSKPATVRHGLSPLQPTKNLPSFLGRGPTPSGLSFVPTREPIRIVSARAGANSDTASLSFDDNETTGWSNRNELHQGWIEYQLAQPALVSELTLKVGGWRTKSYPVRITVDGQEVFRGQTAQSLGYITLPLTPTKGSKVTIALMNAASDRDTFDAITELSDPARTVTSNTTAAEGNLEIREIEFYAPVTTN